MRRYLLVFSVIFSSFAGGVFAQTIGSGVVRFANSFGIGTPGNLVAVGPTATNIQDTANIATGFATMPMGVNYTSNIAYSGASAPGNSWLAQDGLTLSGAASINTGSGRITPNEIFINDTADTTTSGNGYLDGLLVQDKIGAGAKGGRSAIEGYANINGTPTTLSSAGYVGVLGLTRVGATLGGATGAYANYLGTVFGGGSNVFTGSGATFLSLVNGHEFDVTLASGSSAAEKHGLTIILGAADAVAGVYDDNAIQFAAQNNASAVGWTTGIMFGAYAHQWPFNASSTLIGVQTRQVGTASVSTALYGVDLSGLTVATGGAAFVAPLITPTSSGATCKAGSIVWDTDFIYICTATDTWKRATLGTF